MTTPHSTQPVRTVAVGGLGAIGRKVAARLDAGIAGLRLEIGRAHV